MKRMMQNALIVCVAALLTLILLEGFVRLAGEIDADGQFTFMGYALEPYSLPVNELRANMEDYLAKGAKYKASVIYDEMLGWVWRPHATRHDGELTINSAGMRSRGEYSQEPPPDTLRIALFGDSFVDSSTLPDDEAWGNLLEVKLNQTGIRTEVLNFGVAGYGMDQAFLRWRHEGKDYDPDIVIFGFMSSDLDRNVNIFRRVFRPNGGISLTKPRFILTDQGLELLNQPTLQPEELIAVFESFESHPLAPYEHYYQGRHVAGRWWTSSRLAAFIYEALKQQNEEIEKRRNWGPDSERGMLGQAIVDAFAADVMAHDAEFFVLYLPGKWDLRRYRDGQPQPYQFLLDHFEASYHYIPFEEYLDPRRYADDIYHVSGHYGPEIEGILAQTVADAMQSCVESPACDLPRFEDRSALFTP